MSRATNAMEVELTTRKASAAVVSLATARREREERQPATELGSIGEAWRIYQESGSAATVSRRTVTSYRAAVTRAQREIGTITRASVQAWARDNVERGMSASTANWLVRTLRAVVTDADNVTDDDRFAKLRKVLDSYKRLVETERTPRVPPADIVVRLMQSGALRNKGERAFVMLIGTAGLRIGEMLGLGRDDYDDHGRTLTVHRQRQSDKRKNRKPLIIAIEEPLAGLLYWTKRHGAELAPSRGPGSEGNGRFLFPWGKSYMERFMSRLRAELPEGYLPHGNGWHAFRHLVGTEVFRSGGDVSDAMAVLGDHSASAAMTYNGIVRGVRTVHAPAVTRRILDVSRLQVEMGLGASQSDNSKRSQPTKLSPPFDGDGSPNPLKD